MGSRVGPSARLWENLLTLSEIRKEIPRVESLQPRHSNDWDLSTGVSMTFQKYLTILFPTCKPLGFSDKTAQLEWMLLVQEANKVHKVRDNPKAGLYLWNEDSKRSASIFKNICILPV